jgi:hypothetical protein
MQYFSLYSRYSKKRMRNSDGEVVKTYRGKARADFIG